jgi:hypothetical protein
VVIIKKCTTNSKPNNGDRAEIPKKVTERIMEKNREQNERKPESGETGKLEGLPMEDSPYLKYKDLEDYKRQGYGTEGHQQPKPGRGAGSTDAPTLSGGAVSSETDIVAATDAINRQGVP